jgi:hypothetical protein
MSAVIYSEFSREIISVPVDPQTIPKISLTPTSFSDETSLLYNLWVELGYIVTYTWTPTIRKFMAY